MIHSLPEKHICIVCGSTFQIPEGSIVFSHSHGYELPKRCKACRKQKKEAKQRAQAQRARELCETNEEKGITELLGNFSCKQASIEEISLDRTDDRLFVIGNGFDRMHGVPSS